MYEFIQKSHSGWAYLAFLILIIAFANACIGLFSKKEYKATDLKIGLYALGVIHIQLVIGLIIYFVSPNGFNNIINLGMSEVMKNAALRLTVVEHPFVNILGIVIMTVGWVKHKKLTSSDSKFKTVALYYGIGLAIILSRIPWDLWF